MTTPAYVPDLLDALLTGQPVDFHGREVPSDVQDRLARFDGRKPSDGMTTPGGLPAWTPENIAAVADTIRAYLRAEMPEAEAMFFNDDAEEMAMRVWPVVAEQVQAKIAAEVAA